MIINGAARATANAYASPETLLYGDSSRAFESSVARSSASRWPSWLVVAATAAHRQDQLHYEGVQCVDQPYQHGPDLIQNAHLT